MARNVELEATIADGNALEARVAAIADEGPIDIHQDDTFSSCPNGGLTRRDFATDPPHSELIYYQRADAGGPETSFYERSEMQDQAGLCRTLALALGEAGRVVKRRRLYLVGRTRVHLDAVECLGGFVELEVVLGDVDSVLDGEAEARRLMDLLGSREGDLVVGAYVDLLAQFDEA